MTKKITIEHLAIMVQKGFEGVDKKFEVVDKRFENIENRLDRIENRLDLIESELHNIKQELYKVIYRHEFELLKDRVTELEKELAKARKK